MVWLYINNTEEFQQKCDIVHTKGDRRAYNAVVTFKVIEEKQIKHMRYRKKDMAVVHKCFYRAEKTGSYRGCLSMKYRI